MFEHNKQKKIESTLNKIMKSDKQIQQLKNNKLASSKKLLKEIEKARKEVKRGEVFSFAEVKRKLKLS
jgi:hypothetical protein